MYFLRKQQGGKQSIKSIKSETVPPAEDAMVLAGHATMTGCWNGTHVDSVSNMFQ